MKESFVIYKSFYAPIEGLSLTDKGKLLEAIFDYQINGKEVAKDSPIFMAFAFFKNQFGIDNKKYQAIIDRNQSNGLKGGRPRTQANPKNPVGKNKPKKAVNVNVNDTVNVNETDNDIVNAIPINRDLEIPELDDFLEYGNHLCGLAGVNYRALAFSIQQKYDDWISKDWKDGHGNEIKNWKNKLGNTLPHLKPINNGQSTTNDFQRVHEELGGNRI